MVFACKSICPWGLAGLCTIKKNSCLVNEGERALCSRELRTLRRLPDGWCASLSLLFKPPPTLMTQVQSRHDDAVGVVQPGLGSLSPQESWPSLDVVLFSALISSSLLERSVLNCAASSSIRIPCWTDRGRGNSTKFSGRIHSLIQKRLNAWLGLVLGWILAQAYQWHFN